MGTQKFVFCPYFAQTWKSWWNIKNLFNISIMKLSYYLELFRPDKSGLGSLPLSCARTLKYKSSLRVRRPVFHIKGPLWDPPSASVRRWVTRSGSNPEKCFFFLPQISFGEIWGKEGRELHWGGTLLKAAPVSQPTDRPLFSRSRFWQTANSTSESVAIANIAEKEKLELGAFHMWCSQDVWPS